MGRVETESTHQQAKAKEVTEPLAHSVIDTVDGPAEIVTRERAAGELVDNPELPYQTDVLSGPLARGRQRYDSLEAALAGHVAWVGRHEGTGSVQLGLFHAHEHQHGDGPSVTLNS